MRKYASKLVDQAKSWLGKKESDGSHKVIINVYNSHKPLARGYKMKYTDAWCACFVSACAIETEMTDIIPTEVGCGEYIKLFKKKGVWIENENTTPKVGDIIFYDWEDNGVGDNKGGANHVGICIEVNTSKKTFKVIEGNYNNAVGIRTLKFNGKYLRGLARPNYDEEKVEVKPVTTSEIKYVYNCSVLNVRSMAGTTYKENNKTKTVPIVRTIKKGTKVNVYEISGSWARIGTNEWVSNKYLTKTKTTSYKTKTVYNCSVLNVRSMPGTTYKENNKTKTVPIVRTIKKGTKVTIYKTSGTWSKISSSKEEWCSSKYLK